MGVRKRIRPKGYGLDFSLLSLRCRLSKYFESLEILNVSKFWRKLSNPQELRQLL